MLPGSYVLCVMCKYMYVQDTYVVYRFPVLKDAVYSITKKLFESYKNVLKLTVTIIVLT